MEFLETCVSFPVAIFSGLLIMAALYWLVAAFGLVDMDSLDFDVDADVDVGDIGDAGDMGDAGADGSGALGAVGSLMQFLGLYGVPLPLIVTFIALFGWLISYHVRYYILDPLVDPGLIRYCLGLGLLAGALAAAAWLTSVVIRPLRPLFKKAPQVTGDSIRGRVVVIRSTRVTSAYGEAIYEDGGAGMLLDVRPAHEGAAFRRGDRAVLLEYDAERRLYFIISEDEFRGR